MLKKKTATTTVNQQREKIINKHTGFHITEAYKGLRTNMMFSMSGTQTKKVVITSSYPGEGKSTTCLNLAITFAQMGKKVLVIDADLRKPTIHQKLAIEHSKGLAHIISGQVMADEAIIREVRENLDVILSGHIPPNPAELLASEAMEKLLETLEKDYEYIFIDTPPLNIVTDATILSNKTSGTVLVVRQDVTHHKDIQQALDKLTFANAKILGFILHDVKEKKRGYGKYNNYEKYGYYQVSQ